MIDVQKSHFQVIGLEKISNEKKKNYRNDETLKFTNKHFVIYIISFIRVSIFDNILVTPTRDMTILYSMMDKTDETSSQRCTDSLCFTTLLARPNGLLARPSGGAI